MYFEQSQPDWYTLMKKQVKIINKNTITLQGTTQQGNLCFLCPIFNLYDFYNCYTDYMNPDYI